MPSIPLLLLLALVIWLWHTGLKARERASIEAIRACQQSGYQFLDGTVALAKVRIGRLADGWLALIRTYQFDYSTDGATRDRGWVQIRGKQILLSALAERPVDED